MRALGLVAVTLATILPFSAWANSAYGLQSLWQQGNWIARLTLLAMVLMSILSWGVLVSRFRLQRQLRGQLLAAHQALMSTPDLQRNIEAIHPDNVLRRLADSSLQAVKQHETLLHSQIELNTWLSLSLSRQVHALMRNLQSGLALLATVGATAPFVGLFGTVLGIYEALTEIGAAGQASLDRIAGPVGESLVMTAVGLIVAVPAVLGYNLLTRRNQQIFESMKFHADQIHTLLLGVAHQRWLVQHGLEQAPPPATGPSP